MKLRGLMLAVLLAVTACPDNGEDDAGSDAGQAQDAAVSDAARPDTAVRPDNAPRPDAAVPPDTSTPADHATQPDQAVPTDSATAPDTAGATDSSTPVDSGQAPDAATTTDSAVQPDAAVADSGPVCTPQVSAVSPDTSLQACIKAYHCAPGGTPASVTAEGGAIIQCFARHGNYPEPMFFPLTMIMVLERGTRYFGAAVVANETCIAAANDCDGVFSCLNGNIESPTCNLVGYQVNYRGWGTGCADATTLELCYGDYAGATTGRVIKVPCPAESPTCVDVGAQGGAFCVRTDCDTPTQATCSGDIVDQCITGTTMHIVRDCNLVNPGAGSTCGDADPDTAGEQAGCVPTGASCAGATDTTVCDDQLVDKCHSRFDQWYTAGDCSAVGPNVYCSADEQYDIPCSVHEASQPCQYKDPVCDCDDFVVCDPKTDSDTRFHCPDYGYRTCGDSNPTMGGVQPGCIE
ncbi:MAG: hypothetical protein JXR83_12655 [Deltaproteobacteria bacterium]|nr:hypothetical protein [Deltaproteobacteria bacterium]